MAGAPRWAPRSGRFAPCAHPTAPHPEYVGAARRRQPSGGSVLFHAAQVLEVTRKTRDLHTNRWRAVTVYAITSLSHAQASPARLADLLRNHWAIEALHHLRDVTFAEDACKVRTGSGPHVMATLRNLVIGVLCRAGPVNVTAALRHHAATLADPSPPSGSISDETVITTERRSPAPNSQAVPAARQELFDDGDELAFGVPFAEIPQRLGHLRQPIATLDDRRDRSRLAEPNQRPQVLRT
jgi:predicted transposase YbfD/YdcC